MVADAEINNDAERFGSAALDDEDTAPSGSGWIKIQYGLIGGGDPNVSESAAAR